MAEPQDIASSARMDRMARSYDRYGPLIVPHYDEMQAVLLEYLSAGKRPPRLVVDLGAGTGILLEKVCQSFPATHAVWVDRSTAMRAVAEERLAPYRGRVQFMAAALQDLWDEKLPEAPDAILSMSAIHHLDGGEKELLYRRCYSVLGPGGCFWTADEVRAEDEAAYLHTMREWDAYVTGLIEAGRVDSTMAEVWAAWRQRNLETAGRKRSGDDCHSTVCEQLAMLRRAGFASTSEVWARGMWSIFGGCKAGEVNRRKELI